MGHIGQHSKSFHTPDKVPALPAESSLRLVAMTAGKGVCVVPGQVDKTHAPGIGPVQLFHCTVQQLRPLYREKCGQLSVRKRLFRLRCVDTGNNAVLVALAFPAEHSDLPFCRPGCPGQHGIAEHGKDLCLWAVKAGKLFQIPLSGAPLQMRAGQVSHTAEGIAVGVKIRDLHPAPPHQNACS